jgi:hypothetical protein
MSLGYILLLDLYLLLGFVFGVISLVFWKRRKEGKLMFLFFPIQGVYGYRHGGWSLTGWVVEQDSSLLSGLFLFLSAVIWPIRLGANMVLIAGLACGVLVLYGWNKACEQFGWRRKNRRVVRTSARFRTPLPPNLRRDTRQVVVTREIKARIAELREEYTQAKGVRDHAEAQMQAIRAHLVRIGAELDDLK